MGSDAIGGSITSQSQPQDLAAAVADGQQAYALGVRDTSTITDLSFGMYSLWLEHGNGAPPSQGLQLAREDVTLDGTVAMPWFNLGLYQLASGDASDASATYRQAVRLVVSSHEVGQSEVAGALTDLDNLATSAAPSSHPGLLTSINAQETLIAASAAGSSGTPDPTASEPGLSLTASDVSAQVSSSETDFSFTAPPGWDPSNRGRDLSRQRVLIVWYERATDSSGPWTADADLMYGWQTPALLLTSGAPDTYSADRLNADASGQCLPPGEYRVDMFVEGRLVFSDTHVPTSNLGLVQQNDANLELGACVPAPWTNVSPNKQTLPDGTIIPLTGIANTWEAPSGSRREGVALFRLYLPRGDLTAGATVAQAIQSVLETVVSIEVAFPSDLRPDPGTDLSNVRGPDSDINNGFQTAYVSPSTSLEVWAGAGTTSDHAIVVGMVWGAQSEFSAGSAMLRDVFASIGPRCGNDAGTCP